MRKDRERLVRQRFSHQVVKCLPQFKLASFAEHWSELPCFRWRIAEGFIVYVTLQIDESDDRFSINLTWMLTDRPPIFATPGAPTGEPNHDGLTINLGLLWSRNAVQWKVKYALSQEELSAWLVKNPDFNQPNKVDEVQKIFPRVDDAVQRIIDYGIPYLKIIVERYRVTWPGMTSG